MLTAVVALPLVAALAAPGCSGPPVPTPIDGEPVCHDVEVGAANARTKMRGGLKFPVSLTIKQGKTVVFKTTLQGLRTEGERKSQILLPDGNEEYAVEWAQCENEQAPRPAGGGDGNKKKGGDRGGEAAHYECGNAAVYKTDSLATKKHDPASHALKFPAPPKAECWASEAPATPAMPSGSPGAPAAPTTTPSATPSASPSVTTTPEVPSPSASSSAGLAPSASPKASGSAAAGSASATAASPRR